jgi:hypothetical protein
VAIIIIIKWHQFRYDPNYVHLEKKILCNVVFIVVCPFVIFILTIVLPFLLFTASDYLFGIFKLFFQEIEIERLYDLIHLTTWRWCLFTTFLFTWLIIIESVLVSKATTISKDFTLIRLSVIVKHSREKCTRPDIFWKATYYK